MVNVRFHPQNIDTYKIHMYSLFNESIYKIINSQAAKFLKIDEIVKIVYLTYSKALAAPSAIRMRVFHENFLL